MERLTSKIVQKKLLEFQDVKYRDFQANLIPNIAPESYIGVRTPQLRMLAKDLKSEYEVEDFLNSLPHKYFDENQLQDFIIGEYKDFDKCIELVENFLPYVNNWATCDQLSPKIFKKHHKELLPHIFEWMQSSHAFTVRFGIGMLMQHFLNEDFKSEYLGRVCKLCRPELKLVPGNEEEYYNNYYVNMMVAWYFATALCKQWDSAIIYIEKHKLNDWCHKKAIQKARESFRITAEQKEYLKNI